MIGKLMFACSFTLVFAAVACSQTRLVTNADLEKYRQKRVSAEKELNENYAKLGFESPDIRAKRNAQSTQEMIALSDRLRTQVLARELAAAEAERQRAEQARYDAIIRALAAERMQPVENSGFLYNGFYHQGWNRWPRQQTGGAWRAGGGGLVYEPGGKSSFIWNAPIVSPGPRAIFRPHP